jgi:hypothetical protein
VLLHAPELPADQTTARPHLMSSLLALCPVLSDHSPTENPCLYLCF